MATRTIYTCDKCGHEQENTNQFWTVGVSANCSMYPSDTYVDKMHMNVCRPCLESFGIHVRTKAKPGEPEPKVPTLEELITEIVQRCQVMP